MQRLCPLVSTVVVLTGLVACGDQAVNPSHRVLAVHNDPGADTSVTLRHRFRADSSRRYRCQMRTVETSLPLDVDIESLAAQNGDVQHALSSDPVGQSGGLQDVVMVEEESCHGFTQQEHADVSYRCLSYDIDTYRDGERVYDFMTASDSLRSAVAAGTLRELFEPIRYVIDGGMRIRSVELPDSMRYSDKALVERSYRRALEARYQSFFPDHAVRPGDTWTGRVPLNEGMSAAASALADLDYVLDAEHLGYEQKEGRWCVVVGLTMRLDAEDGVAIRRDTERSMRIDRLAGRSRVWFDYAEGMPVLEESRLRIAFHHSKRDTGALPVRRGLVDQWIRTAWLAPNEQPVD